MSEGEQTAAAEFGLEKTRRITRRVDRQVVARQRVNAVWAAVCDALLKRATEGDLTALRMVMQMAGLEIGAPAGSARDESLAKELAFARKTLAGLKART